MIFNSFSNFIFFTFKYFILFEELPFILLYFNYISNKKMIFNSYS